MNNLRGFNVNYITFCKDYPKKKPTVNKSFRRRNIKCLSKTSRSFSNLLVSWYFVCSRVYNRKGVYSMSLLVLFFFVIPLRVTIELILVTTNGSLSSWSKLPSWGAILTIEYVLLCCYQWLKSKTHYYQSIPKQYLPSFLFLLQPTEGLYHLTAYIIYDKVIASCPS